MAHDQSLGAFVERLGQSLGPMRSFLPRPRRHRGVVYRAGRASHALALTFDDGPSEWTPKVLDVLREHGARATFFVLGSAVRGREETLRRMAREGHEVGNHLDEHHDPRALSDEALEAQLQRAASEIAHAIGIEPRLVRPPYGRDARRVARIAGALGLGPTVLGSIDPRDWRAQSAATIVRHVLAAARTGGTVFLHDGVPPDDTAAAEGRRITVDAVAQLVPELTSRGYGLLTVSELLGEHVSAR